MPLVVLSSYEVRIQLDGSIIITREGVFVWCAHLSFLLVIPRRLREHL